MNYNNLLLEIKDHILFLTINRESKLNALNKLILNELHFAITGALTNHTILGIIITGAGEKAFVAGADISEFMNFNTDQGHDLAREGQTKVFDIIENSNKPIIAAINGFALGGGLELAMACHIRIAAELAKLGLPEVSLGLIPGYGGTQRLTQLVGKGRAMEMILTAKMISATEGLNAGLINHVVPKSELMEKCLEVMQKIITKSPISVGAAISAINASCKEGVNGFEIEMKEFSNCFGTKDFKEGVSAFLEKRLANFTNN